MKKHIHTLLFCLIATVSANAQNVNLINDLGIEAEERDAVQERIKEKVDDFQRWIQDLAARGNVSHKTKMELKERTLKLFIGEGKSYTIRVPTAYGFKDEMREAVKMSTISSKFTKKSIPQPMTSYLSGLIRRSEQENYIYKKIVIESADAVRVDNLSKVGDGKYMATAHILQHFVGYRGDNIHFYEDYTAKTITIYINRVEIATPEGVTYYWEILLGDVTCDDIW